MIILDRGIISRKMVCRIEDSGVLDRIPEELKQLRLPLPSDLATRVPAYSVKPSGLHSRSRRAHYSKTESLVLH
jgi:hypothetical protein